jgi:arsenite methyltransferase
VTESSDRWHRWLLNVRHGGDAGARERDLLDFLYPVRDKVLDGAQLRTEDLVLDVGAGDGLIAFGALDRLSPAGRVICSTSAALSRQQLTRWTAFPTSRLTWSLPGPF